MNLFQQKFVVYVKDKDYNAKRRLDRLASDLIRRDRPISDEYKDALQTILERDETNKVDEQIKRE